MEHMFFVFVPFSFIVLAVLSLIIFMAYRYQLFIAEVQCRSEFINYRLLTINVARCRLIY